MNNRQKAILDDIRRFRFMSRDQICTLHFSHLKTEQSKISNCNLTLKRLVDRGFLKAHKDFTPFIYSLKDSKISSHSQKTLHFTSLVDTYIHLLKYDTPKHILIEPRLSEKGSVEPDLFVLWKGSPWFIEKQLSTYTENVMNDKMNRYLDYYYSDHWKSLEWQPNERKIFPLILLLTDTYYNLPVMPFKILQVPSIQDLIQKYYQPQQAVNQAKRTTSAKYQSSNGQIKIKIQ